MTQALGDVLSNRDYAEPPEIRQIKAFVQTHLGLIPSVAITTEAYIIRLNSAAAAGVLRTKVRILQQELDTNKRIVIRIS